MTEPEAHGDAQPGEATGTPKISLVDARNRVVAAIEQALADRAIDHEQAADLRIRTQAAPDHFTLDDQVVFTTPALKKRFCRWPCCFEPPRPPEKGGNRPAYCVDGRDEEGRPHDDPTRSRRRRETYRAQTAGPTGTAAANSTVDRPYSLARATAAAKREGLEALLAQLIRELQELRDAQELSRDEELRLAEIANIRNDAARAVDEEQKLRLDAEAEQRTLQEAHDRMASDLEEATAEAERKAADADTARRDRAEALAALDRAEEAARGKVAAAHTFIVWMTTAARLWSMWLAAEAQWRAETDVAAAREALATGLQEAAEREQAVRRDAEDRIAAAKAEFTAELASRTAEMQEQVEAANADRDAARTEAAEREQAVQRREVAAAQSVSAAQAAQGEAKAEAAQLREENTRLREAALTREEQHGQATAQLVATHRQETETQQRRLDDERQRHQDELDRVRAEARSDTERQLALLERAYKAEVESLQLAIQSLTDAARRTDADPTDTEEQPPPGT